jgi:hypothetical protein
MPHAAAGLADSRRRAGWIVETLADIGNRLIGRI